jgi:hypothetical protein
VRIRRRIWGSSSITRIRPALNAFSFNFHGQNQAKRRFAGLTGYCQLSMMGMKDAIGNAESQAGAWYPMANGRASEKPLENSSLFPFRDSFPVIRNFNINCIPAISDLNLQRRARRRIFRGVIDQLFDGKPQQPPIECSGRDFIIMR